MEKRSAGLTFAFYVCLSAAESNDVFCLCGYRTLFSAPSSAPVKHTRPRWTGSQGRA